jgi:hypothetical protein
MADDAQFDGFSLQFGSGFEGMVLVAGIAVFVLKGGMVMFSGEAI